MEKTFKVGDLKRFIAESSNEFKPVLGVNVEKDNKSINDKAYKDAKQRAKDYDGGLENVGGKRVKYEKNDANRTTLDYEPENVSDDYKKRVKAQVDGYTSELEKNNKIEKSGDFSDNENIYNGIKKSGQELHNGEKDMKKSGLQGREWPEKVFDKEEMYESKEGFDMKQMINRMRILQENSETVNNESLNENRNIKTIFFKKTEFLTEGHMLSRIPDEFKTEGEQFKMKDKTGNTYLVEWKNNKGVIISHSNKQGMNESLNRMKDLYSYSSTDTNTTLNSRLNEDANFNSTLNNARKIK